jgi:hypothetical protein
VTRYVYTATSLVQLMADFERHYGRSSASFYRSYAADEPMPTIPRHHQHAWASFIREVEDMKRYQDFTASARDSLALA